MTAETILPMDNHIEEPEAAEIRHSLGVRQVFFRRGPVEEDPNLDGCTCPPWCHTGRSGGIHEVDPGTPYSAYHALGMGPVVAASLYPGTLHRRDRKDPEDLSYIEAAHLSIWAGQDGNLEPEVTIYLRTEDKAALATLSKRGLRLTKSDAQDLIKALGYVVDVLEGRREPIDGVS